MSSPLGPQLKLYFSEGRSPFPKADPQTVLSTYGAASLQRIEDLAEEIGKLTPDWSIYDLSTGTDWAVGEMKRRHPDLDDSAAKTLGWAFSYWNK
jgi:hypothetical protein